jgi:hypothetical protein
MIMRGGDMPRSYTVTKEDMDVLTGALEIARLRDCVDGVCECERKSEHQLRLARARMLGIERSQSASA